MARPLNHSRAAMRSRMARNGVDNLSDFGLPAALTPPRPRQSKAALRAEIEQATAAITRIVKCRCGHQATIALPPSKLKAKLRCSKCGSIAETRKEKAAPKGGE